MMKSSASRGYPPAMTLYGKMLLKVNHSQGLTWMRKAVAAGGELAAAQELSRYYMSGKKGDIQSLCKYIENEAAQLAKESLAKIQDGGDANGLPQLCLAYIGMYDLGGVLHFSRGDGRVFLRQSLEKGDPVARVLSENPALQAPESWALFKNPLENDTSRRETEKKAVDPEAGKKQEAEPEPERETPAQTEDRGPTPFCLSKIVVSAGKGAVVGLLCHAVLSIDFPLPFLLATAFFAVRAYRKSAH